MQPQLHRLGTGTTPAAEAMQRVSPRLVGVARADEVTDLVGPRTYLHAGPPIALDVLPGPMRSAVVGALRIEGQAANERQANRLIDDGEIALRACHEAGGVGAMAGLVSPSTPVVVVEGPDGRQSFSPLNEGLGKALRFGSTDEPVLARLRWMSRVLAPVLDAAIHRTPDLSLVDLMVSGLRRGDECHNRNVATSSAMIAQLAPSIVRSAETSDAVAVLEFAGGNPHFFLSFGMAAAKSIADAQHIAPEAGLVTAMASNGHEFGIRVAGLGDRWFTSPAPVGEPRLFPGYSLADAQPMMGDSFITETIGLGAFALTAAPAISSWIGVAPARARELVDEMRSITVTTNNRFISPFSDTPDLPLGIDVRLVARREISPVVNNGVAHRRGGEGQVGAGLTRLPLDPFVEAAQALDVAAALESAPKSHEEGDIW